MSTITIDTATTSEIILTDSSNNLDVTSTGSINVMVPSYCVAVQTSNIPPSSIIIDGSLNNTTGYGIQVGNPPTNGYLTTLTINTSGKILSYSYGIICFNGSTIETLNIFGEIISENDNNISNNGTIVTVNNRIQLTYEGNLPINYYIVINTENIGYFIYSIGSESINNMNFNIHNNSILTAGTYSNVITGLNKDKVNNLSGTFGIFTWNLVFNESNTSFDLVVTITPSPPECVIRCPPRPIPKPGVAFGGTENIVGFQATQAYRYQSLVSLPFTSRASGQTRIIHTQLNKYGYTSPPPPPRNRFN